MGQPLVGIAVAVFMSLGVCPLASAELTAFWRNNPITPQAAADDPALAGMQSWSVMVTNTSGFWASAGLRAQLPTGRNFYRNPFGDQFRPSTSAINAHPALEFHTYVTEPRTFNSGLVVLGSFPDTSQPASFGGPTDTFPGTFSVAWGDVFAKSHPPGTFEIARLTFPADTLPVIHPKSRTEYVDPGQVILLPTTIPEPSFSMLWAVVTTSLVVRRRKL